MCNARKHRMVCIYTRFRLKHNKKVSKFKRATCEKPRRFSPGTWQLQPPKPSLQWHWWSKHTPFVHCDPSSLSQSSEPKELIKYWHPPLSTARTYLNIWALFSVHLSPCSNLAGHRIALKARKSVEIRRTRWLDIQSIRLPSSEKTLRVCCRKGFSYWKIVKVPAKDKQKGDGYGLDSDTLTFFFSVKIFFEAKSSKIE